MNNATLSGRLLNRLCTSCFTALFCIFLLSTSAAAAEPGWRPVYDKVMLWVNFFILVFVIVKYGRTPFMNFLKGQKDEVADKIHRLQKQKNALDAKIKKAQAMIEDSSIRFDQIKSRIIEDGERAKLKIIEDAKLQSINIVEVEKLKAANQITQAKEMFISELVDEASALAQKKLPSEITDSDHNNLLDLFLSNISQVPESKT